MMVHLREDQRQVCILALVELLRRRPGWEAVLVEIVDQVLDGHCMRLELTRLHDELGHAYSSTWQDRLAAAERTLANLTDAVTRLEMDREHRPNTRDPRAPGVDHTGAWDRAGGGQSGGNPDRS